MDELQRSIYVERFQLAFHKLKGAAFQDWFVRLLRKYVPMVAMAI